METATAEERIALLMEHADVSADSDEGAAPHDALLPSTKVHLSVRDFMRTLSPDQQIAADQHARRCVLLALEAMHAEVQALRADNDKLRADLNLKPDGGV